MIGINFLMKSALAKETENFVEESKTNKDKTKQNNKTKTYRNWLLESMPLMQIGKKIVYSIDNWCKLSNPLTVFWFPHLASTRTNE